MIFMRPSAHKQPMSPYIPILCLKQDDVCIVGVTMTSKGQIRWFFHLHSGHDLRREILSIRRVVLYTSINQKSNRFANYQAKAVSAF